jgi:hypothetical protein
MSVCVFTNKVYFGLESSTQDTALKEYNIDLQDIEYWNH